MINKTIKNAGRFVWRFERQVKDHARALRRIAPQGQTSAAGWLWAAKVNRTW